MKGSIHSYESLAAVDGEGLRFAVFLSGCPLRCVYCHNPDTHIAGECTVEPEKLVQKLLRYTPYFSERGGVTFSGGEPLLQADFLLETAKLLSENKIGYILDTSGAVPLTSPVREVLKKADSVLLDLKFWDRDSYRRYCGDGFDNMLATLDFLEKIQKKTVLRTVIVPGINDTVCALDRYLAIVEPYSCVEQYELLPFHTLGFFKYEKLGIRNPLADVSAMDQEAFKRLQGYVRTAREKKCDIT